MGNKSNNCLGVAVDVRPIKTKEDYDWAMAQIDELWETKADAPDADRLEVLTILLDAYEEKHHSIPPPDPVAAIEYYMDTMPAEPEFEGWLETVTAIRSIIASAMELWQRLEAAL